MRNRMLGSVFSKTIRDWLLWTIVAVVAIWLITLLYVGMMTAAGDEYISLMISKLRQDRIVGTLLARGLPIPTQGTSLWEKFMHLSLDAFSTGAKLLDARAAAVGTFVGHIACITTSVTN